MPAFNVTQKKRRAALAERKRAIHGDPYTAKLKNRTQPKSVSGKRKRKLLKKWRRDQKECLDKGVVTMEDIELAVSEGKAEDTGNTPAKISKKRPHLRLKKLKRKGKDQRTPKQVAETSADAMEE